MQPQRPGCSRGHVAHSARRRRGLYGTTPCSRIGVIVCRYRLLGTCGATGDMRPTTTLRLNHGVERCASRYPVRPFTGLRQNRPRDTRSQVCSSGIRQFQGYFAELRSTLGAGRSSRWTTPCAPSVYRRAHGHGLGQRGFFTHGRLRIVRTNRHDRLPPMGTLWFQRVRQSGGDPTTILFGYRTLCTE